MQVSVETLEGLERKMTVQVPAESIETAVNKKLSELSKTIRLDGFRPGKVPLKVIKQKFGGSIRQEVLGDVIESSYREALQQEKIQPAGMPSIEPVDLEDNTEGLTYAATFEVYPEIETLKLEDVKVERAVVEIQDSDVDAMVEKLREQRKTWETVERAAKEGDQVTTDFAGSIDGEAFEGGTGKDMVVEIGGGRMLKEFEDGLNGMAAGEEKVVQVNFPEDYHGKDVAGKTADFQLNVSKVEESVLPEIDEEFIKAFGVEDGSMETFRSDVKGNMEKELKQKLKTRNKDATMTGLLEVGDVIAPKAMVGEEIKSLRMQMVQNMGQDPKNMDENMLPDNLFEEEADKRVRLGLLVNSVMRDEKVSLDNAKFNEVLQEMADSYDQPQELINYYTTNDQARSSLEGMVLEDQIVDIILSKAQVSDKEMSFEELMQPAPAAA